MTKHQYVRATCPTLHITCLYLTCSTAIHRRLLLWNCRSECDYACQHVVTDKRLSRAHPYINPVVQYHGKWPFYRYLGMQEPFSVLFSLFNYLAHTWGLAQLREKIPASYPLRKYYILFGLIGCTSWTASMVFHTRDFKLTERLDYFAAGANVLYGMYYSAIRIFRLDDPYGNDPTKASLLRMWTMFCAALYVCHVMYLTFWSWDYTYNMAANIAVGVVTNILWTGYSFMRYRKSGRWWQAWPGLIVAWVILAMSLEILDFVPWRLMIDAHSLWHAGTVGPTVWWYR
jgi:hypothetical protein